jgi:hypothetical protein
MTKPADKEPSKKNMRGEKNFDAIYYQTLREAERVMLRDALIAFDGDMREAAKFLGVSYSQVYNRVRMLGGITPGEPRREPYTDIPYVKVSRAKHNDGDSSDDDEDDDQGDATDRSSRTSDGDDAEQERHHDTPS